MDLSKTYEPKSFEREIYKEWEDNECFKAKVDKSKKPFTIVMPPPNITGQLHMGHAMDETVQDALIRYKRMKGFSSLYLPGSDHASIATEVKIVEAMKEEGITKADIGREGFLERAWKWKEKYGNRIVEQQKFLGISADWSRAAFTMDKNLSAAVNKVFVNMYEKGYIYRGDRIINWCPKCKTALSDAEVEYEEKDSFFWHIKYESKDKKICIIVATTRPETMLGDTAIAVNPKDERYKDLIGKTVILPLVNREIPIIADEYVDMEFGTGAVKITPAHDPNDYEVGRRHNLEVVRVMNDDGTMNEKAGVYNSLDRFEARKQIVKDLEQLKVLIKIEPHKNNVGTCYRCHDVIEPIVSRQWFVKMDELAKPAVDIVKSGELKFMPKRFENIYFSFMENIRDWCISRQLWWGHRIPAYFCQECGKMHVAENAPEKCSECGSLNLKQDEDVLDTWFSSALWPFSTLGYPNNTEDLKYFYPTDVLVTAYDIIFFWVARMIFSGIEHMKEKPFDTVLIHGIVRDENGRKMSKSLGNGIDPLEIIDKYGADSLRFSLINGIAQGSDTRYSDKKVEATRNFMNKIWNACRFALMNMEGKKISDFKKEELSLADKWILTHFENTVNEVTINMDKYELGIAAARLYDFVWGDLCDWYIEFIKPILYGENEDKKQNTLNVLNYVITETLKMLHPFVPYVTEKLWKQFDNLDNKFIMLSKFPTFDKNFVFEKEESATNSIKDLIKGIRNLKTELNVPASKKVNAIMFVENSESLTVLKQAIPYLQKLANIENISFAETQPNEENFVEVQSLLATVYIEMSELVDAKKEIERLTKEKENVKKEIDFINSKLNNNDFINKAPQKLVDNFNENLKKQKALLEKVEESLKKYVEIK